MFKVILFLLVALGAALSFPTSRVKVLDAAEPVISPMLEWSTKGEIRKITRDLETFERTFESLPATDNFVPWLSHKYTGEEGTKDSWGNEYWLEVSPDSFSVVSAGVDGQQFTPDDVGLTKARVQSGRRRR